MIAGGTAVAGHAVERGIFCARLFRVRPDPAPFDPDALQMWPKCVRDEQVIDLVVFARDGVVTVRPAIGVVRQFLDELRKPGSLSNGASESELGSSLKSPATTTHCFSKLKRFKISATVSAWRLLLASFDALLP